MLAAISLRQGHFFVRDIDVTSPYAFCDGSFGFLGLHSRRIVFQVGITYGRHLHCPYSCLVMQQICKIRRISLPRWHRQCRVTKATQEPWKKSKRGQEVAQWDARRSDVRTSVIAGVSDIATTVILNFSRNKIDAISLKTTLDVRCLEAFAFVVCTKEFEVVS